MQNEHYNLESASSNNPDALEGTLLCRMAPNSTDNPMVERVAQTPTTTQESIHDSNAMPPDDLYTAACSRSVSVRAKSVTDQSTNSAIYAKLWSTACTSILKLYYYTTLM